MEWISVKDRLPPTGLEVFVYDSFFKQRYMSWLQETIDGKEKLFVMHDDCSSCGLTALANVTHWLPLPPAPSTEEMK